MSEDVVTCNKNSDYVDLLHAFFWAMAQTIVEPNLFPYKYPNISQT